MGPMNKINHFLFSLSLSLPFVEPGPAGLAMAALFSLVFGVLVDLDHMLNKDAPWYLKRTWIQEPTGLLLVGLPLALLLGMIDKSFIPLVLVPYGSHILLDYLCIFEARPLAPFLDVRKREGLGIFVPDDPLHKSENSRRWAVRAKAMGVRGVSENYFTLFSLALLAFVLLCTERFPALCHL